MSETISAVGVPGTDAASASSHQPATPAFEVVLVTYHSRGQVDGLLETLGRDQRMVVVDNASGADGLPGVAAGLPATRYVDGGDVGFARAANIGARSSTAEYLVFVNPDARPTPQILSALVADLAADPSLASVAAATVNGGGGIELGVGGWEPTPARCLASALGLHVKWPQSGVYARPRIGEPVELGWITGACLAVRRETFLGLGGFDERYFVYNEDMAFGRAVRESGLRQRLRTDLLVPHATSSSGGGGTRMPQQRGASMAQYLADHNGRVAASVMRACLAAGMLPRIGLAAARGRRAVARQHRAYITGIVTRRSPYRPS